MDNNNLDPYGQPQFQPQFQAPPPQQPPSDSYGQPQQFQPQFQAQQPYGGDQFSAPPQQPYGGDQFQAQPYSLTSGNTGYEDIPSFDSPPAPLPTDADLKFDTPGETNVQTTKDPPQDSYRFWQVNYYRPYFDVDTKDVGARMLKSILPVGENFFDFITPTPDLYGPFWIASTVVFLLAAASTASSENVSIATVSYAAAAIYGYCFFTPLILWAIGKWWMDLKLALVEHWCIYGYSFSVYIPAAFILLIPQDWLRWVIMAIAGILSTLFLVKNYFKPYHSVWKKGLIILICQAVAHLALAFAFKIEFFLPIYDDNSSTGENPSTSGSVSASTSGSASSDSGSGSD